MLLQQTSKYLMRTIGKKIKTKVLDLSFVHEKVDIDFDVLEENLRNVATIQTLIQDLLRVKYFGAEQAMKNLA